MKIMVSLIGNLSIEEYDEKINRRGMELPKIVGSDLSVDEMDYINLMLNYWDKNIPLYGVGLIKTYKGKFQ